MPTYKILVPDIHMRDVDIEAAITGDGFEYEIFDERDAAAIPDKSWRDCDIVLMWHRMQLTASVVELLDNCRLGPAPRKVSRSQTCRTMAPPRWRITRLGCCSTWFAASVATSSGCAKT